MLLTQAEAAQPAPTTAAPMSVFERYLSVWVLLCIVVGIALGQALLLGLSSISVPWATLITSVLLYIVLPVLLAQAWRRALLARGPDRRQQLL